MKVIYNEEVVQLDHFKLTVDWFERLTISVTDDGEQVNLEQGPDFVAIPKAYLPDIIKALRGVLDEA